MSAEHHRLNAQITGQGDIEVTITCPHDHGHPDDVSKPWAVPDCTTWTADGSPCICDCDACRDGNHADCQSSYVDEIGHQWCEARPMGLCFYTHVLAEVGVEMLNVTGFLNASWPVEVSGHGWDESIDVSEALR